MTGAGKILVVDDNVALAENVAEILEHSGYSTAIAASAEAALERMAQLDVTGLVTDYRLPGRNGAQLIAEIRRRGSVMPAVVMSAFADDDTIAEARTAGALEVLAKPLEFERLMAVVALM